MKLSSNHQKRLTGLIWIERMKKALPAVLIIGAIGAVAIYMTSERAARMDRTVEVKDHAASILVVKRPRTRGAAVVTARLDDGRVVDAVSQLNSILVPDDKVTIAEAVHASGRHTYDVIHVGQ